MSQGIVFGSLLFLLYTSELFFILENKLIGYADDSTLMAVVPSPCVRVTVAESLVSEWCDLYGMKLNTSKTKMMVSRSRTIHPRSPPLTIVGTAGKSDDLVGTRSPCGLGVQNSANVCPCACRKRRLTKGYKLSYTTGLLHAWHSCMQ